MQDLDNNLLTGSKKALNILSTKMNLKTTFIKLSTIMGLPYLFTKSSKCNFVAW
jgi:hypothetical protein